MKKISIYDTLLKINISVPAAKIYEYLYMNGADKIINISNNLGIIRTSVYDYVDELVKAGLVCEKEIDGKNYFQAENVDVLINKLKVKEDTIRDNIKFLTDNKKELNQKHKDTSPVIRFYEGVTGLHSTLDAILYMNEKEILSLWPKDAMIKNCGEEYLEKFNKKRISKNKKLNVIWSDSDVSKVNKNIKSNLWESEKDNEGVKRKIIKDKKSKFEMGYVICGDTVAYLSATEEVYGFVIKSDPHAKLMSHHFNLLWEQVK